MKRDELQRRVNDCMARHATVPHGEPSGRDGTALPEPRAETSHRSQRSSR
jgi:hypothetical protein